MGNKARKSKPISRKEFTPVKARKVGLTDYKDIALLHKSISDRDKICARRVTGVATQERRLIVKAAKNAREMALFPYSSSVR